MSKRWVIALVAVPAVLAAAVAAMALSFDPNSQKDRVIAAVRRSTGRELILAGPVHLTWSLLPTLEAQDVSFANMPGGTRPAMATAAKMEAQLRLWPLLTGRVEFARLSLLRPDILIETDATGRGNWQFDRAPTAAAADAAAPTARPKTGPAFDTLEVEAGRLTWHDGVTGRTLTADIPLATLQAGAAPMHLVANAVSDGTPVKLDATLGTLSDLTASVPAAWPVKLAVSLGKANVALTGMADPVARRLSGRVEASIPDLARLGTLLGYPTWPPMRDIHVAATLPEVGGLPQDVSVQLGEADLGRFVPGATLSHLSLTWPAAQPARLEAEGALAGAAWHAASGLVPVGLGAGLRGFKLASALGDLAGDVALTAAPRLAVRGTLVSTRLDLDGLLALRQPSGASPVPVSPAMTAPVPTPPVQGRVFSDAPLPWSMLQRADADLQLSIGTLHAGGADYRNATGHVVLQDALLRIDPASVQAPEGRVDFSTSVDARVPDPSVILNIRSGGFALDPLLRGLGLPGGSDATAELDATLHASGATPHALAASLDGHVGIAMVDGDVSNAALSAVLGDVMRSTGAKLDATGRSHVRCLAIRADAQSGQVGLTAVKLDTSRLLLEAGGALNLRDETVALHLRPLLRLGVAGVSAPVRLDGPLRHPIAALDSPGGTGRVGVTIGGLAGPAESCTAELTAARNGRSGPLPAEIAAAKPGKPADLLRSLLR